MWRKSGRSGTGPHSSCIEVALVDSRDLDRPLESGRPAVGPPLVVAEPGGLTQHTMRPGDAVPEPDRRNRVVDEHLVRAVNGKLAALRPRWTGGRVDAARVQDALAALPQGGPSDPFGGLATDIASKIATTHVVRVRAGAVGWEAETRPVVRLREGVDKRRFRIDARDGSFSVVLDSRKYFQATDGTVYRPLAALERDGKTLGYEFQEHILEIVTAPVGVVPGDVGRANGDHILAGIEEVIDRLKLVREGQAIESIFPRRSFTYSDEARDAVVLPDPAGSPFDLHLHFTAGVPITRMHEFLSEARDRSTPGHPARNHLADGLKFGNEIAAGYARTLPDHAGRRIPPYAVHLLAKLEDVSALRGFLALVYAQVAPIVHGKPGPNTAMKTRAAAASRTSLAGIRATLPEPVRAFLKNEAAYIRQTLLEMMQERMPELRGTDPLDRRDLKDSDRTIGEYLNTALLDSGWPPPINQYEALGVDTHFDVPDDNEGNLQLPLVLVELRRLGERPYPRQTMKGLRQQSRMVTSMAKRAYMEAGAIKMAPGTDVGRRVAAATVTDLAMFGHVTADPVQEIDWVPQIELVLAAAWRLDPVLRGSADAGAVITEDQVRRIVRATSAVLLGDHSHVEALSADLSVIRDGLNGLVVRDEDTEELKTSALQVAEKVIADLRRMRPSTGSGPLTEPAKAAPEHDRRSLVVDEDLVTEVNSRLKAFDPTWTGDGFGAAWIQEVSDALPEDGPSDVFDLATDIALEIVEGGPSRVGDGLTPATGFEVGGLDRTTDELSMLITTPAYFLVVERMNAMRGPNAGRVVPTIEIVLEPVDVVDGVTGRLSREGAFGSLSSVLDRLRNAPRGSTVAEVFHDVPGAVPHQHAHRATLLGDADPGRSYTQLNVGVPASGIRELLRAVAQGNGFRPDWAAHRHAESALVFGDEVAARYAGTTLEGGVRGRHVEGVRNYATLVYTQVGSVLHGLLSDSDLMRQGTLIASRTPLVDLRRSLPRQVRKFLREEANWIRDLFQDLYRAHNGTMLLNNRFVPESGDLLAVEWSHWNAVTRADDPAYTIRQYLDNALIAVTDPAQIVDQWESMGIPTLSPEMGEDVEHRRSDPLVVLEVHSFGVPARHEGEEGILHKVEREAGLEVMFGEENHLRPDWRRPDLLEQFEEFVAQAAEAAAERGTLFVNVQGGGGGDPRSNAYTTGLDRADAVIQDLTQRIELELRVRGLPEDAVGFIRSSRGSRDGSDYPFAQAEGTTEERRQRVHVWIDSSGRRPQATEPVRPDVSTTYAPRYSPAWVNALTAEVNSALTEMTRQQATVAEQRVRTDYAFLPDRLTSAPMPVVARRIAELILTDRVILRRGGSRLSTQADPATPGPGDSRPSTPGHPAAPGPGGLRPVEPPVGKGKGKDAWRQVVRPVTEGFRVGSRYEVSGTGGIRLSGGRELSSDSWVRHRGDFVHLPTGMSLRGEDGRIEPAAAHTLRDLRDRDGLMRYTVAADESYVYLVPESGGPAMGLPFVVAEPGSLAQDIDQSTPEGTGAVQAQDGTGTPMAPDPQDEIPDVRVPSPVPTVVFGLSEAPDDLLLSQAYLYRDRDGGYGVGHSGLDDGNWHQVGALAEYSPVFWLTGFEDTGRPESEVTVGEIRRSGLADAVDFLTTERNLPEADRVVRYLDVDASRVVWQPRELPEELPAGTWIWFSGGEVTRAAAVVLPGGFFHIYIPGVHSTEVQAEFQARATIREASHTFVIATGKDAGVPFSPPGRGDVTDRGGRRPDERSLREVEGHAERPRRFGIGRFVSMRWVTLPRLGRGPGGRPGPTGATEVPGRPATGAAANEHGRSTWRNVTVRLAGVFPSVFRAVGGSRQRNADPSTAEPGGQGSGAERLRGGFGGSIAQNIYHALTQHEPGSASGGAGARVQVTDDLVDAVNGRLPDYGPAWADWTVDREDVEEALLRLSPGRPTYVRGLASDLASMIAKEMVPRLRGGAIGLELETGFELGGLGDVAEQYPKLITTPEYSLVVDYIRAKSGPNAGRDVPIIEIVLNPVNALDGETGWLSRDDAFDSLSIVLDRLRNAPRGSSVAEVFRDVPGAVVHRYADQARLLGDIDRGRIYTQFNVGVPMSGVQELLRAVARGNNFDPDWVAHRHAESALVFGDEVAAQYAGMERGRAWRERLRHLAAGDADVARVRNYATLVYAQVAAMLHWGIREKDLAKNYTMIAARTPLAELRRSLPDPVRRFLREEATRIRALFQDLFRKHNGTTLQHNRRVPRSGDLLAVEWSNWNPTTRTEGPVHTIGEYLDNALVAIIAPARLVDQWESLGVRTQLPKMDDNFGRRRSDPLVVLEIRSFGGDKHESMGQLLADYDRLERAARREDKESGILQQVERGTAGLEVMFAKAEHGDPDWGRPGALERFVEVVSRMVTGRRAAERGTVFVIVEGGGNGGLISNAYTTGLDRADAVIKVLNGHLIRELGRRKLPEKAVGFIRSSRGSRDRSDYPFARAEGTTEDRRRRVHVWIDTSVRRPAVTEQAQPEASTSYTVTDAPRFSRAWTNALITHVNSALMEMTRPQGMASAQQRILTAYNSLPERLTNDSMPVVAGRVAEFILTGQVTLRPSDN